MEGPSLVIASEEFAPYLGQKVQRAQGAAKLPFSKIKGQKLGAVRSWGKHFLLQFENIDLRIHFLMFGSYRIDKPRANRIPKMQLRIGGSEFYFYSCAIKVLDDEIENLYDWSVDVMSKKWSARKALIKIKEKPRVEVCDILMDQDIFAGVGNIIKNEVLFLLAMHPEVRVGDLSGDRQKALVKWPALTLYNFISGRRSISLKRIGKSFVRKFVLVARPPSLKLPPESFSVSAITVNPAN